ncbi:hypothetical protein DICVIV_08593 [Dictyocaulus viviparus]|uniref:Uncharacterized protein n=1 Tax=Dictyocaulus viviparus TaxID=29172 RepID=A0A0D8XLH5_DICVI|nr:hypothetical protein DICVIV_08593 [Dictyocaulus viviparus]
MIPDRDLQFEFSRETMTTYSNHYGRQSIRALLGGVNRAERQRRWLTFDCFELSVKINTVLCCRCLHKNTVHKQFVNELTRRYESSGRSMKLLANRFNR